jgi:hypothetical protein
LAKPRARTGAGSALYMGNGDSPETFMRLAMIQTIKDNGMKQAEEKVTNQDSDIDQTTGMVYQEEIGTIVDPGTLDVTLFWVPNDASHQELFNRFDNQPHNYQIRGPLNIGSSPLTRKFTKRFQAQMFESPSEEFTVDKAMLLTLKLQRIGQPDAVTYDDAADSN